MSPTTVTGEDIFRILGSFSTYRDGTNDGGDLVDDLLEFLQRDGACVFQFFNEEFHVVLLL